MKIMDFLFGKKPNIFDNSKDVRHELKTSTWQKWKNRYLHDTEYDWQRHQGIHFLKDQSESKKE